MTNPSKAPGEDEAASPAAPGDAARGKSGEHRLASGLVQADRLAGVGVLAAGLAHEINNPLAYALFNLESIAEDVAGVESLCTAGAELESIRERLENLADFRERLEAAVDGMRRVRELVQDLETFSSVHSERLVPLELRQVIDSVLRLGNAECRHRARVVTHFQETPLVLGNPSRLAQVFLNLVVNAAQAIPEGRKAENEIRVVLSTDGEDVVVEVRDTGVGIPPEQLGRLFEPFFTTKPIGIGSGLGLSVCHNVVSAHGGSIEVESTPGQGSSFRVRLPASTRQGAQLVEEPPVSAAPQRRLRVLVVDDEPQVGKAVRRMLSDSHQVTLSRSGDEARRILDEQVFDVVVCDLMMPNVSGMDLYDRLQRTRPEMAQRVVFMTGGAFTERARRFVERVDNVCLGKPFNVLELRRAVERLGSLDEPAN